MAVYKAVGLRLEGTLEQVEEALRRIGPVMTLQYRKIYPHLEPDLVYAYTRAYFKDKEMSIFDALEAAQRDIQHLEEELREADRQIERLKKELGILPEPRPGDVVLGSVHKPPED